MFTFHYVNREQDFRRDHRSAGANNVLDILGIDTKGNFLENLNDKTATSKKRRGHKHLDAPSSEVLRN